MAANGLPSPTGIIEKCKTLCLEPDVLREQDLWPTTSPALAGTGHMLGRCSALSTWIRVVKPVPTWVSWINPLPSQLTPALFLYLSATETIPLVLQYITSPTTATYTGRICPYGHQRQPSFCPPRQVRPHVVPTYWARSPCRPTILADLSIGVPMADTTPVSPSFRGTSFLQVIDAERLASKEGVAPFQQHKTFYSERSQRAQPQAMAEQDNQDFHDDDPAPTGSRGTQRAQRGRGARARRRPSQTEILAGNVRDLTELVRTLVDTRRDANVVQFPEEPPEVAESTPSRPPRSGSRPRNPSPTGGRGSDRTRRESPRRQQQERADPSRVRSRSRHSQAIRSAAAGPPAATGGMPGDRVRETVNVRGSTTSVFDRLGRPGVHRRIGRERSVDKPAKDEDYNQNRLDQLQRQLDQLVGQQYGMDQLGAVGPPFTPFIMASPYPTRFKMPSVNPYDGSTDADEHIENYQAHMLI
ncbi:hypothetical protein TIFTF001_029099 [Ficus carica]|uniref:Uncharacterized protein n=1 Tax=Ficus carica TaxID=3494 RepID=A0AA88DRT2_FICCA|nr:hypothetical protein TIFTF001_029099 [Ficus carica]